MSKKENSQKLRESKPKANILVRKLDVNRDGKIDIEDMLIKCMQTPGIRINRENFLRNEFSRKLSKNVIDKAVIESPMKAGIKAEFIDRIAMSIIRAERLKVSGLSAVLSMPGGLAMIATIPADMLQYYSAMLRVLQKLLYLYGFPQLDFNYEGDILDSESMSVVVACLGIMFGVGSANKIIHNLAPGLAKGLGKKLMATKVTQTAWYPVLKKVAKTFSIKITKDILKGQIEKFIPIVGFAIGGAITYFSFGPCCKKLVKELRDTILSNPNYVEPIENIDNSEIEKISDSFEVINNDNVIIEGEAVEYCEPEIVEFNN